MTVRLVGSGRGTHSCPARRDARGLNSIELAIILPVLLLVVFGTVQLAVWHHAANTAHAAAAACAERARGFDSSAADGRATAEHVLEQVDGLDDPVVGVVDNATEVTCTVTGTAPVVVTLGQGPVTSSVTLPKEHT